MFNAEPEILKPKIKGCVKCQNCGAEFTDDGGWCKGINVSTGTETPQFVRASKDIPKGKCIVCGSKELIK